MKKRDRKKRKKNLQRQRTLSNRALKDIRRRNKWEKHQNFLRNKRKKIGGKRVRHNRQYFETRPIKKIVEVPSNFTLISNMNDVLKFFEYCKSFNSNICNVIHFDFDNVQNIGNGAITILLSICGWLNDHGVKVTGSYPADPSIRSSFEKSGFLKYFKASYSKRENMFSQNEILQRGIETTNPTITARKIREAMKTVWGIETKNTKLQGMLIELMANTVNHAYVKKQKGWYLSVNHNPETNKVKFCFVDNGQGILNTIKVRFRDKFSRFFGDINDGIILEQAFEGRYGSRTQLTYRGRGLPAIKKNFESNVVKNLVVISNNVCITFADGRYELLPSAFNGTFYYWELDRTCRR